MKCHLSAQTGTSVLYRPDNQVKTAVPSASKNKTRNNFAGTGKIRICGKRGTDDPAFALRYAIYGKYVYIYRFGNYLLYYFVAVQRKACINGIRRQETGIRRQ